MKKRFFYPLIEMPLVNRKLLPGLTKVEKRFEDNGYKLKYILEFKEACKKLHISNEEYDKLYDFISYLKKEQRKEFPAGMGIEVAAHFVGTLQEGCDVQGFVGEQYISLSYKLGHILIDNNSESISGFIEKPSDFDNGIVRDFYKVTKLIGRPLSLLEIDKIPNAILLSRIKP